MEASLEEAASSIFSWVVEGTGGGCPAPMVARAACCKGPRATALAQGALLLGSPLLCPSNPSRTHRPQHPADPSHAQSVPVPVCVCIRVHAVCLQPGGVLHVHESKLALC